MTTPSAKNAVTCSTTGASSSVEWRRRSSSRLYNPASVNSTSTAGIAARPDRPATPKPNRWTTATRVTVIATRSAAAKQAPAQQLPRRQASGPRVLMLSCARSIDGAAGGTATASRGASGRRSPAPATGGATALSRIGRPSRHLFSRHRIVSAASTCRTPRSLLRLTQERRSGTPRPSASNPAERKHSGHTAVDRAWTAPRLCHSTTRRTIRTLALAPPAHRAPDGPRRRRGLRARDDRLRARGRSTATAEGGSAPRTSTSCGSGMRSARGTRARSPRPIWLWPTACRSCGRASSRARRCPSEWPAPR